MSTPIETTVNWPESDYQDEFAYQSSGEGGLMVYAVWPFYATKTPTVIPPVTLSLHDVLTGAEGPLAEKVEKFHWDCVRTQPENWTMEFASAVLLGSTYSSLHLAGHGYFSVARSDLTDETSKLLEALERIHGGEATLITLLDT